VTLLAAMYWPVEEIDNAVNVAQLESNWNTAARNTNGEDSRGLWQINVQAHAHLMDMNLFDPQVNAFFAHQIWKDAGSWRPWLNAAKKLGLKT
jgi:hypothetical protein